MTDFSATAGQDPSVPRKGSLLIQDARTKRRNAAETRFRLYGLVAIGVGVLALMVLLTSIFSNGASAFRQPYIFLSVELPEAKLDKTGTRDPEVMKKVTTIGYTSILTAALEMTVEENGISIEGVGKKDLGNLISKEAPAQLRNPYRQPDKPVFPYRRASARRRPSRATAGQGVLSLRYPE